MRVLLDIAVIIALLAGIIGTGYYVVSGLSKLSEPDGDALPRKEAIARFFEANKNRTGPPPGSSTDNWVDYRKPAPSKPAEPPVAVPDSEVANHPKAKLTREDVQGPLSRVAPDVKRCGKGSGGMIVVDIMIAPDGSVSSVDPLGEHKDTPVGDCAAGIIRQLTFPVADKNLRVKYPFKL